MTGEDGRAVYLAQPQFYAFSKHLIHLSLVHEPVSSRPQNDQAFQTPQPMRKCVTVFILCISLNANERKLYGTKGIVEIVNSFYPL